MKNMKNVKNMKKLFAVLTSAALAVSLAGCGSSADNSSTKAEVSNTVGTSIVFSESGVDISGSGAVSDESIVTITNSGTYTVSGSIQNGQLLVEAGDDDSVTLIFDGLYITNEEDAAVYVKNAEIADIIIADGSENCIVSGVQREIDLSAKKDSDDDASGGALRAKCDLTLSGNGMLEVFGYINNGIQSSDNITINAGTIEVTALNHGIKGSDSVTVNGGDITITAMQDGLHSNGTLAVTGGNINIATADDAIHADTDLTIEDGTIDITESYEGIEAQSILISGGIINVVSSDDGINATDGSSGGFGPGGMGGGFGGRGDMSREDMPEGDDLGMRGGREEMNREDVPAREDNGQRGGFGGRGEMNREDMPERDDGRMNGGFAGLERDENETLPVIRITGGTVTVTAKGDGIDSNGDLYIEGGLIIINGPSDNGNGALDYGMESGGECLISGGTVLALGSSGMAETFGADSTQVSFIANLDSSFDEGDKLTVTAEDGSLLFEYDVIKKGTSVVFSSPDLDIGDTLTLSVGDQSVDITLDSVSTSVGNRGFGPFGNMSDMGDMEDIRDAIMERLGERSGS